MQTTYPIRFERKEKRLLEEAARAEGISLAEFIRRAAREKARPVKRVPVCLTFTDLEVSDEARRDPKGFIREAIFKKHAAHR
ncbi:MAG: DUF1778 domain-containing protein [Verrucomicrobiota bacterium]